MKFANEPLEIEIYGESHAPAVGVKLRGVPKGFPIDLDALQKFSDRRKPNAQVFSTARVEPDKLIIKGGIENGKTTGAEICIEIENVNARSGDYNSVRTIPRPGHADYPAMINGLNIVGGGRFSGRMTAPLVAVGGVAVQILKNRKIEVGAFISEIGGVKSKSYKTSPLSPNDLPARDEKLPVLGAGDAGKMIERIAAAKADRDSVGGVVEAVAFGVPVGAGGALYDGIESVLSALLFGIPAVKGVEFGQGFDIAAMTGSAANDQYQVVNGKVETTSNNNGGIVGGMANGAPICVRVAFKPTPSIARPQNSVDLATMKNTTLEIAGRHDACVVPRAVVVVEAALALALLDVLLKKGGL